MIPPVSRGTGPEDVEDVADADVAVVFRYLTAVSHRFLSLDDRGRLTVRLDRLAELVTEIVTGIVAERTERTERLRAELDAADDAVLDVLHERDEACKRAHATLDGGGG